MIEYCNKLLSGEIVACEKLKNVYRYQAEIVQGLHPAYCYNSNYANNVLTFIETFCRHTKGPQGGKLIKLELFQKAKLQTIFGILETETGKRKYKEVFDLRARKNGKSTELAAIALYMLIMDDMPGAEIYSAATIKEQARIVFDTARDMVKLDPNLQKLVTIREKYLYVKSTLSTYVFVGKDASVLDGKNASCIIIDEVHELKRPVYDVMKQSVKARLGDHLINMITTGGFKRGGLYDDIYEMASRIAYDHTLDEEFLPLMYELDNPTEMYDEKCWQKVNPALGITKLARDVAKDLAQTKIDPNYLPTVKAKEFNIRTLGVGSWLPFEVLINKDTVDFSNYNGSQAIGGLDLSRTDDLTAFTALYYDKELQKYVAETYYWITREWYNKYVDTDLKLDAWIGQGLLEIAGDTVIDFNKIVDKIYAMATQRNIIFERIHYDAYAAPFVIEALSDLGFSLGECLIRTHQGAKTLSIPLQLLTSHIKEKKLIYNLNPITLWNFCNVQLEMDRNANLMPRKYENQRNRKIDGFASILNCYVGVANNLEMFS